jgi:hypothetical protein
MMADYLAMENLKGDLVLRDPTLSEHGYHQVQYILLDPEHLSQKLTRHLGHRQNNFLRNRRQLPDSLKPISSLNRLHCKLPYGLEAARHQKG